MMVSAFQSIRFYLITYGLTRLRIYVTACILTLLALLLLTLLRLWLHIPYRALFCGILCMALLAVNYINVDKAIAEHNVSMKNVDTSYLLSLSVDALPTLLAQENMFHSGGLRRLARTAEELSADARIWNYGRMQAAESGKRFLDDEALVIP